MSATAAGNVGAAAKQVRMEGITIAKGFVYGTTATWLGPNATPNQATHQWTAYVRGIEVDMSNYVRAVAFVLHPSFDNPTRTVASPPFEIACEGWGEFELQIFIHFRDPAIKPVELRHNLVLYQLDDAGQQILNTVPVVREEYDELVFEEPTKGVYQMLTLPVPIDGVLQAKYALEEQGQLAQIAVVRDQVNAEITRLYNAYMDAEREIKRLKDDAKSAKIDA
eukprot:c10242_g1_i1.p3 GENE.c10242_g1_i1~~c10242_g1_i1.p3  ORF type:complete len:223 (+),score=58.30 c10242_g1_i1:90-758(+)